MGLSFLILVGNFDDLKILVTRHNHFKGAPFPSRSTHRLQPSPASTNEAFRINSKSSDQGVSNSVGELIDL